MGESGHQRSRQEGMTGGLPLPFSLTSWARAWGPHHLMQLMYLFYKYVSSSYLCGQYAGGEGGEAVASVRHDFCSPGASIVMLE